jgi:tetratricopeptide (TPR) repeat protein/serine/threonine protein kinase
LLHRDLKAGHVIVEYAGEWPRVRLIDAGIAAEPALVAPEVAAGQQPSFRSDLYALGCVLHQTLSGALPDGRDFDLDWPRPLASLLASLLAHDPSTRPASAQQVRRTIETLLPSDAPAEVRGSWPAPGAVRDAVGNSSQQAVPKFRAGVGKMSDKTQEISLGEMEAADPQDPPTQELGPADIEAAIASAQAARKPATAAASTSSAAPPPPAAALHRGPYPQDPPTQELGSVDIETAIASAQAARKPATAAASTSSVAPPPPASAIRQRLSTKPSASPPPPPPESLFPSAQRKADSQRPAAPAARQDSVRPAAPTSRSDSARPSKPSSRPAPPPAAYAHRTSGAPSRAPASGAPAPPSSAASAAPPSARPAPRSQVPAHPDFTKTLAGTGGSLRSVVDSAVARADAANARANAASVQADAAGEQGDPARAQLERSKASGAPHTTDGDSAVSNGSELDVLRDAAARSGSTQRGILQPSAAEASASRRPGPHMPSRKATELGMPAVKRPSSNGDGAARVVSNTPTLKPSANGDQPAVPVVAESVRARTTTAPQSMRDPALDTAPGTLSAVRKADAGTAAASSNTPSSDLKPAGMAAAVAVSPAGSDDKPDLAAESRAETKPVKSADASGSHEPVKAAPAQPAATTETRAADDASAKKAAATAAAESKPAVAEAPVRAAPSAAAPGAAFDVEALFDDKLEPERAVISRPDEPTDPKAKLERDAAAEVAPSKPPRSSHARGLRSWPLLAAAAVLGLVAISLSFRACGSSDSHVASGATAPNVLQPRVETETPATPAASPTPPPAAATAEPAAEAKQPQAIAAADKPATEKTEAKAAAAPEPQADLAGGKTLTAQQARPLPQSLKGGVVPYRANSDPDVDYKAKARELYSSGKYKDAADAYQHATQKTPSDAGAFAGLGASWLAAGQPEKAIAAYQRALQLKPEVSGFQAALGRAYLQKGDKGRAASAYRKALELDPRNSAAKTGLATAQ